MRTLVLTEDEISVLKMALDSEKNVQYNDTDENHIKHHKTINNLIEKLRK